MKAKQSDVTEAENIAEFTMNGIKGRQTRDRQTQAGERRASVLLFRWVTVTHNYVSVL